MGADHGVIAALVRTTCSPAAALQPPLLFPAAVAVVPAAVALAASSASAVTSAEASAVKVPYSLILQ